MTLEQIEYRSRYENPAIQALKKFAKMYSNTTLLTNVFVLENIAVFDKNVNMY